MRIPYFVITVLLAILCVMCLFKSFDYGKGWAIALSVIGVLLFGVLSIISLKYEQRIQNNDDAMYAGDHHH